MTTQLEAMKMELEAERNAAVDAYIEARPQLDSIHNRKIFESGFDRAWNFRQKEIDALSAAIEAAEKVEPVAWMTETTHKSSGEKQVWISTDKKGWGNMESVVYGEQVPLYLYPPSAEIEELRKDAARYRWLREHRDVMLITGFFGNGCINKNLEEVDAAINAAMQEKQP